MGICCCKKKKEDDGNTESAEQNLYRSLISKSNGKFIKQSRVLKTNNSQSTITRSSNIDSCNIMSKEITIDDFELVKTLGKGTFGKVLLAKYKHDGRHYAIKVMKKRNYKKYEADCSYKDRKGNTRTYGEPFIVKLRFAFQTQEKLYMVTDFMQGGELFLSFTSGKEIRKKTKPSSMLVKSSLQ